MRSKSVSLVVGVVVVVGFALGTSQVVAAPVVVLNGSFEEPAFDPETDYSAVMPTHWGVSAQNNWGGIIHHPAASGLYADAVDGIAIFGLESQWHPDWGGVPFGLYGGIQQDLGTMQEGWIYTFSATLFSNSEGAESRYRISFHNVQGDVELAAITHADFDPSALGLNQTVAATFNYVATAADDGKTLRLIMNPSTTEGNLQPNGWTINRTGVDAVVVTAVPEPSAMALLAAALAGMLACARQRRK